MDEITAGIERLRQRERLGLRLFLAFLAFVGVLTLAPTEPDTVVVWTIAALGVAGGFVVGCTLVVFGLLHGLSRCPKCGGLFYVGLPRWRQCAHCGLSLRQAAN